MTLEWLNCPDFLRNGMYISLTNETHQINKSDPELRKDVMTHKIKLSKYCMRGLHVEAERFSSFWRALAYIIVRTRLFRVRRLKDELRNQ